MKKYTIEEDLKQAKIEIDKEFEENENKESKKKTNTENRRKITTTIIAASLIFIILSYLYLGAPVYSYILGLAGSSKINNNEITFKNSITVEFNEETLAFLQELYNPLGDERAVCLRGEIKNNTYFVEEYYKPIIFDRAWNYVSHTPCDLDTIIMLHTHPFKRCEPSRTDRETHRRTKQSNPNILMMVMCGSERFSAVI